MGRLRFQSLIGILGFRRRSKQLTPLSSDVFVSIPDRDLLCLHFQQGKLPSYLSLLHDSRHQVLTYLTGQISLSLSGLQSAIA
jgi:hypothetical protein